MRSLICFWMLQGDPTSARHRHRTLPLNKQLVFILINLWRRWLVHNDVTSRENTRIVMTSLINHHRVSSFVFGIEEILIAYVFHWFCSSTDFPKLIWWRFIEALNVVIQLRSQVPLRLHIIANLRNMRQLGLALVFLLLHLRHFFIIFVSALVEWHVVSNL